MFVHVLSAINCGAENALCTPLCTQKKMGYGAFSVEQLADAADEQHFVVLVIAPVAASLHRLELGELLLPVAQDVRLHPAQLAHLTDGELALGGNRRKFSFPAALLHGAPSRPWPSVSGWRGRSRRDAR